VWDVTHSQYVIRVPAIIKPVRTGDGGSANWATIRYLSRVFMSFLVALFATSTICLVLLSWREPVRAHSLYYRAKTMLTRRNYSVDANDHYVLCNGQIDEDVHHLFSPALLLFPIGIRLA
jgi:hypothetical protein